MSRCSLPWIPAVAGTLASLAIGLGEAAAQRVDAGGRPNGNRLEEAESLSQAFRTAANRVLPSVVKVRTETKGRTEMLSALQGFGVPLRVPEQHGLGSGVIIDSSGIVLTNNHVVRDADEVVIELQDGTELYAVEYRTDPLSDLAVVRVPTTSPLPAARFGDSDALQIGDWVLAVGHPLELETSVSAGIISAKGRSIDRVQRASFLQTDAAINPGNSGGPLVNLRGELVGINTAIASQTGGYQGIGFAIPGNQAREVAEQLKTGQVQRAYLGVGIQELDRNLSRQFTREASTRGVLVTQVGADTPAERAGIQPGDVITHFADRPVTTRAELQRAVERVPVGTSHTVRLVRFGDPMAKRVSPTAFEIARGRGQYRQLRRASDRGQTLGMSVEDISEVARQMGVTANVDGVIVVGTEPGGLASKEGIRPGTVILQVRERRVRTSQEFREALRGESLAEGILLLVREPEEGDRFVVLQSRT
jgi:serine protease Do